MTRLVAVRSVHIDAVFLNVVTVVTETIDVVVGQCDARLQQLVVFVIAHGEGSVDGSSYKQVDVVGKGNPLVVQTLFHAHADGYLSEACIPNTNLATFLLKGILVTT